MQSLAQLSIPDTIAIAAAVFGLAGAVLGCLASFGVSRYQAWLEARGKLARLVFEVSYVLEYPQHAKPPVGAEETTDPVELALRSRFLEIWAAGMEVCNMVLTFRKEPLRRKIMELLGLSSMLNNDRTIPLCGHSFPSEEDAKKHANDLLILLSYK